MLHIIAPEMDVNAFQPVVLPSKAQIFARVGRHGVKPAGEYTGDNSAKFNPRPTEIAMGIAHLAEQQPDPADE